jgi:hypothetical protein
MAGWLDRTGYPEIRNETNTFLFSKGEANARDASNLYVQGYKVFLLIHSQMLKFGTEDETSKIPDHWVCLTSSIDFSHAGVKFTIYTWGNPHRQVPQPRADYVTNYLDQVARRQSTDPKPDSDHDFTLKMFLENYYGYVAARR